MNSGHTYSRKDFYKINLTTGKFIFHYADKSLETHSEKDKDKSMVRR